MRWTLSLTSALIAAVLGSGLGGCSVVPAADQATASVARSGQAWARTGVQALFERQAAALEAGDADAWSRGIADPQSSTGAALLQAFGNLRALGVSRVSFTDLHEQATPAPLPGGSGASDQWHGRVTLAYRIPGVDRADRVASRTVRAQQLGDGQWHLTSWLADSDTPEVFDLPELTVRRTDHVVLAVSSGAADAAVTSAVAERAWARVAEVADGIPAVVLVVPATSEVTAAMIGRSSPDGLQVIGATTVGARESGQPAGADRVVMAPAAFTRLTEVGRVVVLTHEFAHVAMRATTCTDPPLWLSEGIAEYLAYGRSGLEPQTVAAAAIARAARSHWPTSLPSDADFDTAGSEFATAYQISWLAVRELASRTGDADLMRLLHEVAGSSVAPMVPASAGSVPAALRERSTSEHDLTAAVRSQLVGWGR